MIFAVAGCLVVIGLSVSLWWSLDPKQVALSGNTAVETSSAQERKELIECGSAQIRLLPRPERAEKTRFCERSTDDRQQQRNSYIQARRSADAADAQAMYAFQQTRGAAIGASLGLVTMLAAIVAAIYAGLAAHHTRRGANAAQGSAEAFLTVETARLKVSIANGHEIRDFRIYYPFQISNMGRTAATVTSLRIWMNSYPHFGGDNGTISVAQGMIVKPNEIVPVEDGWTHVNHAGFGPPPFPYLSGYLEYETVFGETVTTYFSYLIRDDLTLEANNADGWPTRDKIERKKKFIEN